MADHPNTVTIVSIGDLVADIVAVIDHFPVEPMAHQYASSLRIEPGGAGNFLLAGARLGAHMAALGAIGDDAFGSAIANTLRAEQIDLRGLIIQKESTTTTVVALTDGRGHHVYLGGYGVGDVISMPAIWGEVCKEADAVLTLGYTLQEERLSRAALEAMRVARSHGATIFFDPGPEMVKATPDQLREVLALSHIVLMTEEEIPLMTGGREGLGAARELLTRLDAVCIKRGARGCVVLTADGDYEHGGFPVAVRDTSAAGDSFAAAFIFAFAHHLPLAEVAAFANAMGAAKVQKAGSGTQVPTAREVKQILDAFQAPLSKNLIGER